MDKRLWEAMRGRYSGASDIRQTNSAFTPFVSFTTRVIGIDITHIAWFMDSIIMGTHHA